MSVCIHASGEISSHKSAKNHGSLQHTWKTLMHEFQLYAKTTGKAGTENKYEFPPPMDKQLFYGKCILVNPSGELTVEMWNEFYESVMQFEDIETEEEDNTGYFKDGSDNELEEEPYKIDLKKKE